jgi:hypothetical protein
LERLGLPDQTRAYTIPLDDPFVIMYDLQGIVFAGARLGLVVKSLLFRYRWTNLLSTGPKSALEQLGAEPVARKKPVSPSSM